MTEKLRRCVKICSGVILLVAVVLPGVGIFVVEDTMHPRWRLKADIWFPDRESAVRWGSQQLYLAKLDPGEPVLLAESGRR